MEIGEFTLNCDLEDPATTVAPLKTSFAKKAKSRISGVKVIADIKDE